MTTNTDQQVAQSETLEQAATRLASRIMNDERVSNRQALIEVLEAALRNQIEQCAEIAETCHPQPCICQTCLIRAEAGAAIRKLLRPSEKDGN